MDPILLVGPLLCLFVLLGFLFPSRDTHEEPVAIPVAMEIPPPARDARPAGAPSCGTGREQQWKAVLEILPDPHATLRAIKEARSILLGQEGDLQEGSTLLMGLAGGTTRQELLEHANLMIKILEERTARERD